MTQLTADVSATATRWPVDTPLPAATIVQIDDEIVRVSSTNYTRGQIVVQRAQEGTTAATHASGTELVTAFGGGGGLDASVDAPIIIQAAAGSEDAGSPIFYVLGEEGNQLLALDAYGNFTLRGPSVDPSNDGASFDVWGPAGTARVFHIAADNVDANAQIVIGGAVTKVGFFNATPVARPTGVAVTAEAIHAALISLGLISG
jgi:hypothetical protein